MATVTTNANDKKSLLNETMKTAGKVGTLAIDTELLKKRVGNAIEDAIIDTKRAVKHGKYALTDAIDDTRYKIRRNPWQSVGYAAGAGLGIGFLAGWLLTRNNSR